MTPERWGRVKSLFESALRCDPAGWDAFLAAACPDDPELLDDVRSLLASNDVAGTFLEAPAEKTAGPLTPGEILCDRYRIVRFIARGGMGEVYEAHDEELRERVALKALLPDIAADARAVERLKREIQLARKLGHPAVCRIFDFGVHRSSDGMRPQIPFLTMELVSGPTLAEELTKGSLEVFRALALGRDVAEALAAAHERGVIHRDLKPPNIKLTPQGGVKILDFGLAKAIRPHASELSPDETAGVTVSSAIVLGTAAYMSPEQARGEAVDRRSDIWSFGCVLYEMLAGTRAFGGPSFPDTLVAVLTREPDWTALPVDTPAAARRLLRRCLQKDRRRRFHDIADVRLEVEDALAGVDEPEPFDLAVSRPPRRRFGWLTLAAAFVGGLLVASGLVWPNRRAERPTAQHRWRLNVHTPVGAAIMNTLAISPDGRRIVYTASGERMSHLFVRAMDELEPRPLIGTEGGALPFLSPDGEWVGFVSDGKLRKVSVAGGVPLDVCAARSLRGATWGPDGTIILSPSWSSGLARVSSGGGEPQPLTTPDRAKDEMSHRWPQFLPGGNAVLFLVQTMSEREEDKQIAVLSLKTGQWRAVLKGGNYPRYVSSGHLLFTRSGTLVAAPFDLERLEVSGHPVPVLEDVWTGNTMGYSMWDVSRNGSLVYVPGTMRPPDRSLVAIDRGGQVRPLGSSHKPYVEPAVSPDGRRIAVRLQGSTDDIWVYALAEDRWTRLTFEGDNCCPRWSPDGTRVAFASNRRGRPQVFWTAADGSGSAERLGPDRSITYPLSFTPDGAVVVEELHFDRGRNLLLLRPGDSTAVPFLDTPLEEFGARLSPDGRWLAYVSNESGRYEVYVRAYPGPGGKWSVSAAGGIEPVWHPRGREIFYLQEDRLMTVPITTRPSFIPGAPRPVLDMAPFLTDGNWTYDITPDGRSFIGARREAPAPERRIVIVPDWFGELTERLGRR